LCRESVEEEVQRVVVFLALVDVVGILWRIITCTDGIVIRQGQEIGRHVNERREKEWEKAMNRCRVRWEGRTTKSRQLDKTTNTALREYSTLPKPEPQSRNTIKSGQPVSQSAR
jgi:chromosome condensin MukBEF complex kleisin-like MukF subunit